MIDRWLYTATALALGCVFVFEGTFVANLSVRSASRPQPCRSIRGRRGSVASS